MPVVPISRQSPPGRGVGSQAQMAAPAPAEPWLLMAAAQMHAEGKFAQKDDDASKPLR